METKSFYHLFSNGEDARNFITNEKEMKLAFNRFAVCSFLTGAIVVSDSVEDTHPHALLWGTYSQCYEFKILYESLSIRSIAKRRGSAKDVSLECELYEITDEQYLMNVATYTIVQATKDGKPVMPYDYKYGTGALYFRSKNAVLPWLIDDDGNLLKPVPLGSMTEKARREICGTRFKLPDEWLVCDGFILPSNYVDIKRFERIYRTHNCFRAFMCSKKSQDEAILKKMSDIRGVVIEDIEARRLCAETCLELFSKKTTAHLTTQERILLAQTLRKRYRLSHRQLSGLIHIPEAELRKYVK